VTPSSTSKNGIPINWPPVYQAGRVAQFNWQTGLAVNTIGSLIFVADTGQNLIRQVYCSSGEPALSSHTLQLRYDMYAGYNLTFGQCIGSTHIPTWSPTAMPSNPSVSPTQKPSVFPTISSSLPTYNPSVGPTLAPTLSPTVTPSQLPSVLPTSVPTTLPTCNPTVTQTLAPTVYRSLAPTAKPTIVPTCSPTLAPIVFGSYKVTTVFGTGRAATTDSPGLIGEINTPVDSVFDLSQNYLYLTDQNGGGLIRKLAVTSAAVFSQIYAVKTVFSGRFEVAWLILNITTFRGELQFLPILGSWFFGFIRIFCS